MRTGAVGRGRGEDTVSANSAWRTPGQGGSPRTPGRTKGLSLDYLWGTQGGVEGKGLGKGRGEEELLGRGRRTSGRWTCTLLPGWHTGGPVGRPAEEPD